VLVISPNLTIRDELKKNLDVTNRRSCFWARCNVLSPEVMSAGPYVAVLDARDANIHDCDRSHIVLTNIQQLASSADRWLPQFPDRFFDLILVDEGHHSAATSWRKVFERFPAAKVVNLTATPFRTDRQQIDGELIYRFSFKQAMLKGYIKKLQAIYVAPEEIYFTYEGDQHHHTLDEVLQLKEEEWFSRGVALSPECNKHIVDSSLDRLEKIRQSGTRH
jgi:DNA repair protein RadD